MGEREEWNTERQNRLHPFLLSGEIEGNGKPYEPREVSDPYQHHLPSIAWKGAVPAAAVASDAAGSERGPERFPRSQGRKPLQTSQRRAFVFSPGFKEEGGREEDEREARFGSRGNVNEVSVADEKKKKRKNLFADGACC